jgi:D-glycero-alpha-D-manno-heptose-7-phosphate kinase
VIELARQHGAIGWKLNGAGGQGGSLTFLFGSASTDKRRFAEALAASPLPAGANDARIIPLYLSRYGLRVWETEEKCHK